MPDETDFSLTRNDLLVLGLLLDRPMHGYEILQQIRAADVEIWLAVSPAAIYYSLSKLHRRGLVLETRARGEGPERSIYHLTERGRQAFFAGMEKALASQEPYRSEYDLYIFLLNKIPQDRALALLEQRLEFLCRREAQVTEIRQQAARDPLRCAILARLATCARTEREWLEGILRHLRGEEIQEYQGIMLLTGDLQDFHLPDLIKLIASGRHTGTLTVTDGTSIRTLSFQEGRPACATSRGPDGEIRTPEQVLNDLYDLFRWQEGAFTFDQRMGPTEGCITLHMGVESLLLAGARWVDNWATIQRVVPSSEAIFEQRRDIGLPEGLELAEEERRVWEALDGIRDVADVALACDLTEFETSKALYGLHTAGLIRPGDVDKIRLRRAFREFSELLCRATKPYRASPDDFTCEMEVNRRAADLPIRFNASRIEDHTDPGLRTEELAEMYRRFLRLQKEVIRERFGEAILRQLLQRVISQINPSLLETIQRYQLNGAIL
jgi:DNA-binding PadR family transcriptional regulator